MSEPVELLRQAAEAAPKVLPANVGEAAATLFDLLRQWSGVPSTVRAGGEALAREVLALAGCWSSSARSSSCWEASDV